MIFRKSHRIARFRVYIKRKLRLRGLEWEGPCTEADTIILLRFYIEVINSDMRLIDIITYPYNAAKLQEMADKEGWS